MRNSLKDEGRDENTKKDHPRSPALAHQSLVQPHRHTSLYLISHDHGRPSVDAKDGYERLRGNKIQNLGDGLLVGAIPKHHAVDLGAGHQVAHVVDDAFRVRLIDQQCDHVDVNGVLLAPQRPDVPVRDIARASEDHCNVQDGHFLRDAASSLLLSRSGVCDQGHHRQESQGQQHAITTSATAPTAAPSTPPLTPFAAERHSAKPLHPLRGKKKRGGMRRDQKDGRGQERGRWKDDGREEKKEDREDKLLM